MEESFRKKALAGLVALIVVFTAFCAYMFIIVPEKQPVYFTSLGANEPVLDYLNYSELQETFYEPAFLENYTVIPRTEGYEALEIIPKHNPDLVVSLIKYNEDIYLSAEVYITVGAFGGMDSHFSEKLSVAEEDIRAIARYMGHEEIASNISWDYNDFATFPNLILIPMFFGLMSLVFTYIVMLTLNKGSVLEEFFNNRFTDNNLSVVFFTSLGSGICFLYIWYIVGYGVAEILSEPPCALVLAGAVLFLACGLWLLFHGTPASAIVPEDLEKVWEVGVWFAAAGIVLLLVGLWFVFDIFMISHEIAFCLTPGIILLILGLHMMMHKKK